MRILSEKTTATAAAPPPEALNIDNDLVVILAALLCALICVIGLVAVARCAWLRRFTSNGATGTSGSSSFPPSHVANKGVKKKILRALPKHKFDGSIDGKLAADCVICLAEFADGEEIRILPQCGHSFHVGCIDTWLGAHSSCPSCRQILLANRCQKCGGVPDTVATASSSSSYSGNGNGGGLIEEVEMEGGLKAREDGPNRFLP